MKKSYIFTGMKIGKMKTEFLAKAEENLTAAQVCFDNGLYNACANREPWSSFGTTSTTSTGINSRAIFYHPYGI